MAIHQWPITQQPREKLEKLGAEKLSDAELLAIFLRTGVAGCSAVELAAQLLQEYGSLAALFAADKKRFCQGRGLGVVKYVQLQAVLEMARRYHWEAVSQQATLSSASQVKDFLRAKMRANTREVFSVIFLNSQHAIICYEELFFGTINQAAIYPREIARKALEHNAAAVILAHNHPSGVSEASFADKEITQRIVKSLGLLDISVLDHFIVAGQHVLSFAEQGLL